jgi:hypothetical protein
MYSDAAAPTQHYLNVSALSQADTDILRAALLDGEAAIAAYRSWREVLEWNSIPASWQRILPLLQSNVSRLGVQDPLMNLFRGVRRFYWVNNLRYTALAKQISTDLDAACVPALFLKGTSMIASGYVDRSVRPMDDIDVLVRHDTLRSAIEVLARLGYRPYRTVADSLLDRIVPEGSYVGWPFLNDQGQCIDLHWNATPLDRRPNADQFMWCASRFVSFEGARFRVCDPADQLLHLCAHAVLDRDTRSMRWIIDAVCIIKGAPDLAWSRFVEQARAHKLSIFCADALNLLRHTLGLRIPTEAVRQLRRQSSIGERLEKHSRRWNGRPSIRRMTRAFLDLVEFRRGRSDLFERNVFAALAPWLTATMGTRTARAAALRALYYQFGLPYTLRSALADDSRLAYPALSKLPALGESVDPSAGTDESAFVRGWSIAEPEGRWTVGRSATIAWRIDGTRPGPLVVLIAGSSVANADHRNVGIMLFANGVKLARWQFEYCGSNPLPAQCVIPEHAIAGRAVLALTFEIAEPFIPQLHGISSDVRPLGLLLQKIEFASCQ